MLVYARREMCVAMRVRPSTHMQVYIQLVVEPLAQVPYPRESWGRSLQAATLPAELSTSQPFISAEQLNTRRARGDGSPLCDWESEMQAGAELVGRIGTIGFYECSDIHRRQRTF